MRFSQRYPKPILLSVPHMSGREQPYVREAFDSNWLSTVGPHIESLEEEFERHTGRPSLGVSSGTAAIHLGLKLLGIEPGDEVLTSTLTFVATANPIRYEQAFPTFIDSECASWNLDPNLLSDLLKKRSRLNRLPRALILVHLFGQAADLDPILALCQHYELPILEDAASCIGTLYKGKQVGTFGDIGIFSLGGNKIITATAGGILLARNRAEIQRARSWSTQARDPDPLGQNNYLHSELGYNYRMSNILAAIARAQLEVVEERVQQRRAVFQRYAAAFAKIPGLAAQPEAFLGSRQGPSRHTRWLSAFLINEEAFGSSATTLIQRLAEANIEARPVWKPMHRQKLYSGFECVGGDVADNLNCRGICLPSSSSLSQEEQDFIIETITQASRRS
jgi:pyridoxal phosphate-dependent aminotransferase EpsN